MVRNDITKYALIIEATSRFPFIHCCEKSELFEKKQHKVTLFMGKKNIKLCLDRLLNKLMLHYLSHNYFVSTNACLFISCYFISCSAAIYTIEAS
jgi:hypothetical protein